MRKLFFHHSRALVLIGLSALALPACASEARAAIERINGQFSAAAAAGNASAMAALYAADGQLMPPESNPLRGIDAIRKFWEGALASGIGAVELATVEVFEQGAIATEIGTYELKSKDGKALDHGKYIVVWRREGTKWQLLRDMFSTNVPHATTALTAGSAPIAPRAAL
jgi:uncharacterized protein (TIGR02246 family)